MPRYLIWNSGPGPLQIEFMRVGEAVLRPSLLIVSPTSTVALPHENDRDVARFDLSEQDVARLLRARTELRPPCMMLQCDAFLSPSSARRRWGWSIRISRDGTPISAQHLDGSPLPLRRDGFTRAHLHHIPEQSGMARGHEIIGLA